MMAARRPSKSGQETRDKILDAALETVRVEGLVGTSARAIASTGDFNQALVFYHFGSVHELLLAALVRANERRMSRFQKRLEELDDLPSLVQIARELHGTSSHSDQTALASIVAGWSATSELGPQVLATLQPWNELVSSALKRVLGKHPLGQFVPTDDMAYAMTAMFLGIEMMSRLDPDESRAETLFASLGGLANFAGPVLASIDEQVR